MAKGVILKMLYAPQIMQANLRKLIDSAEAVYIDTRRLRYTWGKEKTRLPSQQIPFEIRLKLPEVQSTQANH